MLLDVVDHVQLDHLLRGHLPIEPPCAGARQLLIAQRARRFRAVAPQQCDRLGPVAARLLPRMLGIVLRLVAVCRFRKLLLTVS